MKHLSVPLVRLMREPSLEKSSAVGCLAASWRENAHRAHKC